MKQRCNAAIKVMIAIKWSHAFAEALNLVFVVFAWHYIDNVPVQVYVLLDDSISRKTDVATQYDCIFRCLNTLQICYHTMLEYSAFFKFILYRFNFNLIKEPISIFQYCTYTYTSQQTLHVYSTLKRRGNDRFHVVSTWNTGGVFVGI